MRWLGALALGVTGCGDDGTVTSTSTSDTDTAGSTAALTTGVDDSTDGTGASATDSPQTTTGLDSTGGMDTTTGGVDTTEGESSESSSTGEPNLPPEAIDDLYFVREDLAPLVVDASIGVLSNDSDPEDDALTVMPGAIMSTAGGTVNLTEDGGFDYQPPVDFVGTDSFVYAALDGGGMTEATVQISVGPVQVDMADVAGGVGGFAIDGEAAGDESGYTVAGGGDVNGDGLDDLIITSNLAAGGVGRAWVVFGQAGGTTISLADVSMGMGGFVIDAESAVDSAAIVGDVDGDMLADVLVGASPAGGAGRAYVVHGKADGTAVDLADIAMGMGGFVLDGDTNGEDAGFAVAAAGDVNGDGLADLAIGAPDGGPIPAGGRTYVVFGKTDTTAVLLADVNTGAGGFVIRGAGFDDMSGTTLSGAGDVNGDGLDDVLVGAQDANAGGGDSGRCYVVFGKTDTALVSLGSLGAGGFAIDGTEAFDLACSAVAGLGDMNGDGLAELAVGAEGAEGALPAQGRIYVVEGKSDGATVELSDVAMGLGGFVIDGELAGNLLGQAVGGPGDIDGDGFTDVVVGAHLLSELPETFTGRGYAVFGKLDGAPVLLADLTVRLGGYRLATEGGNQNQLGWSVAGAGDVNGDGFGDFVISALGADPAAGANAGRSYVVFGGNHTGALSHLGGPNDDVLVGGSSTDVIVAGAGNDELHGNGGSDILYAGAGDDLIAIEQGAFFRIRGGSGFDTLSFADDGVQLDLGVVADVALRDIEAVDLTGSGDNQLTLGLRDLRALVGASRTLRVMGEDTDLLEVDLSGGGFMDLGSDMGVQSWSDGVFTLEVVEPLTAMVTL